MGYHGDFLSPFCCPNVKNLLDILHPFTFIYKMFHAHFAFFRGHVVRLMQYESMTFIPHWL
jgi:hypothetical protein